MRLNDALLKDDHQTLRSQTKQSVLAIVLLAGIVIEVVSTLELTLTPSTQTTAPHPTVRFIIAVFNWLIPLSPFLLLCLLYSPMVRAAIYWGSRHSISIKRLREELHSLVAFTKEIDPTPSHGKLFLLEHTRLILIVSMIVAVVVAYTPYRLDLNPKQNPVGIDTSHYINSIDQMLREPFATAAGYALGVAWGGSRPFFLLAVYFAARLGWVNADVAVKFLPLVLAPLLVLASYLLVNLGTRLRYAAAMTALLSAFSPVVTVGIWAGYFANWLAIIETFAFLGLLLLHLRSPSRSRLALMIILSLTILFTHPWTWLTAVVAAFIFLFSLRSEIPSRLLWQVGGYILGADLLAEFLKSVLIAGSGAAAAGEVLAGGPGNPLSNISNFLPNVVYAILGTYQGLLANSMIIALALVAVITFRCGDRFERLVLIWVTLTSLAFPLYGDLLQSRLIYNLPIAILAAFGLLRGFSNAPLSEFNKQMIIVLVVLFNANYALLAVAQPPIY